jgi:hypothetical protein
MITLAVGLSSRMKGSQDAVADTSVTCDTTNQEDKTNYMCNSGDGHVVLLQAVADLLINDATCHAAFDDALPQHVVKHGRSW